MPTLKPRQDVTKSTWLDPVFDLIDKSADVVRRRQLHRDGANSHSLKVLRNWWRGSNGDRATREVRDFPSEFHDQLLRVSCAEQRAEIRPLNGDPTDRSVEQDVDNLPAGIFLPYDIVEFAEDRSRAG